jgi:Flp pilus assembly protein TadG
MRSILKDRKGQNLVEFALVVPLLLLLVIGIAELGRAWMSKNILTGAAREASRLLAVPLPYGGDSNATARANAILDSARIPVASRSVTVIGESVGPFAPVTAKVEYDFPVSIAGFIPGLDNTTIHLESETTMRREY